MFGATILVPLIWECLYLLPFFASGVEHSSTWFQLDLKFQFIRFFICPFITAMSLAMKEMGGDVSAAQTGLSWLVWSMSLWLLVFVLQVQNGLINSYHQSLSVLCYRYWSRTWQVQQLTNWARSGRKLEKCSCSSCCFLDCCLYQYKGKGLPTNHSILFAIIGGYLFALTLGLLTLHQFFKPTGSKFWFPCHLARLVPLKNTIYFGPETIAYLANRYRNNFWTYRWSILLFGSNLWTPFLKERTLHRTLLNDGIATLQFLPSLVDQPAYNFMENTGVIYTRIASVSSYP